MTANICKDKMFKFGKTKVAKVKFYGAEKLAKIWDVDVDKMFISKAIKTKNSSKYLTGYLNDIFRPLVLILLKMSGYIKNLRIINNKLR